MRITKNELATVLAALRTFQARPSTGMEHFRNVRPLHSKQIDDLCERLNCCAIMESPGRRKKENLKVVVHIEEGIVQAVYANVRKAAVKIYDTDPDFSEIEKEKRGLARAIRHLSEVY